MVRPGSPRSRVRRRPATAGTSRDFSFAVLRPNSSIWSCAWTSSLEATPSSCFFHVREFFQQAFQGAARETAEFRLGHAFRGIGIGVVHGDAQEVAGEQEPGDLAPPVGQQLEQLDHAVRDVEQRTGGLALVQDRGVGVVFDLADDIVEPVQLGIAEHVAQRKVAHVAGRAWIGLQIWRRFRRRLKSTPCRAVASPVSFLIIRRVLQPISRLTFANYCTGSVGMGT